MDLPAAEPEADEDGGRTLHYGLVFSRERDWSWWWGDYLPAFVQATTKAISGTSIASWVRTLTVAGHDGATKVSISRWCKAAVGRRSLFYPLAVARRRRRLAAGGIPRARRRGVCLRVGYIHN